MFYQILSFLFFLFLENFIISENNIISVELAPRYYSITAYIEAVLEQASPCDTDQYLQKNPSIESQTWIPNLNHKTAVYVTCNPCEATQSL
jgi:hypothetical protein